MKQLFALLLLVASAAFAQTVPPPEVTSGALELWVSANGTDGNTCLYSNVPCRTIQGALDRVPKRIKNAVTIRVGAGTYPGFAVTGFKFEYPDNPATGAYLLIEGLLANVTPTTGSATGTATSATAGSAQTFGTLTKTAAAWTANDFRGKLLEIVSGTGSGQIIPIYSNTDTVITIVGLFSPAPDSTSVYAIREPSARITTAASSVSRVGTTAALTAGSVSAGAAAYFSANVTDIPALPSGQIILSKLSLEPASGRGVSAYGPGSRPFIRWSRISATATNAVLTAQNASLSMTNSYATASGTSTVLLIGSTDFTPTLDLRQNLLNGGGTGLSINGVGNAIVTSNAFRDGSFFGVTLNGVVNNGQFNSNRFDCVTPGTRIGISSVMSTSGTGGVQNFMGNAGDISNCGTGISVTGAGQAYLAGVWSGTGNTTAILLGSGGRLRIASGATITGTTEVSIEGEVTTLAKMRAAVPKSIHSMGYGSTLFE